MRVPFVLHVHHVIRQQQQQQQEAKKAQPAKPNASALVGGYGSDSDEE
jgi:hypothetical protein